jgi:predicted Zn-dependent protease with MMP-like domain
MGCRKFGQRSQKRLEKAGFQCHGLKMETAAGELFKIFDRTVEEVWIELQKIIPPEFRRHIDAIQFLIYDKPPTELLADLPEDLAEFPEELCGLHVGTPITDALITSPDLQPIRVYLFRRALVDLVEDELEESPGEDPIAFLKEEIAVTLLHEIGHSFGLSEDDLERLGYD